MAESIIDLMQPEFRIRKPGHVELRFPVKPEFTIGGGRLQGGMVAVMLDMAMAMAAQGGLSTASLHFEIHRPAIGEYVDVVGKVMKEGRRILFAEAQMRDPEGRLIAKGTQTAVPLEPDSRVAAEQVESE